MNATCATRSRWCAAVLLGLVGLADAGAETVTLSGDYGYESFAVRGLDPGELIDARGARFRVANSKTIRPTADAHCESGSLPVNPYPLRIYDSPSVLLIGGQFDGEVPMDADWEHARCNSAAVGVWDSPNAGLEGVRARRVWDAVRVSVDSQLFKLENLWLSEVRDDCVENDFLRSGLIKDVLFDGCFTGISLKASGDRTEDRSAQTVTLAGVLMRLQPYPYKGETRHGAPIKADNNSPQLQIYDSVLAMTEAAVTSRAQLAIGWDKIADCRNNVLLWVSDMPWPAKYAEPPSCFRIVWGEQARSLWDSVRKNWINCHFSMARFSDDPASDPLKCNTSSYGGQY